MGSVCVPHIVAGPFGHKLPRKISAYICCCRPDCSWFRRKEPRVNEEPVRTFECLGGAVRRRSKDTCCCCRVVVPDNTSGSNCTLDALLLLNGNIRGMRKLTVPQRRQHSCFQEASRLKNTDYAVHLTRVQLYCSFFAAEFPAQPVKFLIPV